MSLSSFLTVCSICVWLAAPALGHGGIFRGPSGHGPGQPKNAPPGQGGGIAGWPIILYPGSGPQILFDEERWEFWWEYNHDALVNVRERLQAVGAPHDQESRFTLPTLEQNRRELIPFLVTRGLKDRTEVVRSAAVLSLAKIGDPLTVPYLLNFVAGSDGTRRASAAAAESNSAVRTNAIVALGIMQSNRAVAVLEGIMRDDHETDEVRSYAATSLGMIGGAEATGVLKSALESESFRQQPYQLRLALCYAIGLTRAADLVPLVNRLAARGGDEYLQRALLVQSLGQLNGAGTARLLLAYLRDKETVVRRSAALALGAAAAPGDREVTDALMRAIRDDNDNVTIGFSYLALGRLGKGGHDRIRRFLLDELTRAPHRSRSFVALALGLSNDDEAEDRLLKVFAEERELSGKAAVAVALGLLGSVKAASPLRAALDTPDPVFRSYVALALGMIGDRGAVAKLKEMLLGEADIELLYRSAIALGLLGDRTVLPDLVAALKKKPDRMKCAAYVYAIGKLAGGEYLDQLTEVVNDLHVTDIVRAFAVLSMGLIGESADVPRLSQLTRDVNYTIGSTYLIELWNML